MTAPIRTLIVDDEPLARDGVRLLLETDSEIAIIGECANGDEAVEVITREAPDLVFLDIQMPGTDGFGVLRRLHGKHLPLIVFVTAFDQYAVDAFAAHALDYLLKPVDTERFVETLKRAKTRIQERSVGELSERVRMLLDQMPQPVQSEKSEYWTRITIRETERIYFVAVADIDYIAAADYYLNLHTGDKSHLLRMSMSAIEQKLDPERFVRIHRSTIVNVSRIKELVPHFRGEYHVILRDGTR
ncbi:MAG TPA: LytTR family DNA-binding domain-containing protein, partial [candidate division Zixibacteria bacterium]|nr:LytTR family DNA-binding domain-containing protein [candidate division Zixibacteria bacterium]